MTDMVGIVLLEIAEQPFLLKTPPVIQTDPFPISILSFVVEASAVKSEALE